MARLEGNFAESLLGVPFQGLSLKSQSRFERGGADFTKRVSFYPHNRIAQLPGRPV